MAYGDGDATFRACGGEAGLRRLVERFYAEMDTLPEARRIRRLHPPDLEVSIDKLARFLCGWTGGPKRYSEKYGPIRIPVAHQHLPVLQTGVIQQMIAHIRATSQPFTRRTQIAMP